MGILIALVALMFLAASVRMAMVTPPARLAAFLRRAVPVSMIAAGAVLTLIGRGALGVPLVGFGLVAYRRLKGREPPEPMDEEAASTVRSEWLDMVLDHASGSLDGTVAKGIFTGRSLRSMSEAELHALRDELSRDADSLRLLEAYLDRRVPGWRANAQRKASDGLGGAPGTGPMTEQEAHQILGLEPRATLAEIRDAHRRLMKRVHPDHGGTDFLAARINEAKAFLIERHR